MVGTVTPGLAGALSAAWQAIRRQHSAVPDAAVRVLEDWLEPCGAAAWRAATGGDAMPDVVVSGAQLREGAEAVFAVLLHEAAHGVALSTKVKDVADDGRLHTVRYTVVAGRLGLEAEQVGDRGYAATTVMPATQAIYAGEIQRLADALAQVPVPADDSLAPVPGGTHRITVYRRPAADGTTWLGVNVCRQCEPDPSASSPRPTFSVDDACPRCGGPGELEWRRMVI